MPADDLGFDYVERELTVTRTENGIWGHGLPSASKLTLDLLLAEHISQTPMVAELKIGDDKDLYYALIQALACIACLATPNQYARLRKHLNHRGAFPDLGVYTSSWSPQTFVATSRKASRPRSAT